MNRLFEHFKALRNMTDQGKSGGKPFLRILAVIISAACLFFALRGINWSSFWKVVVSGNFWFLPVTIVISSSNYFFRALRWRVLLKFEKPTSPFKVFWADMVGYLGNNIFPARAGELIRAIYLGNEYDISSAYVFATCMLERVCDVFALVIIGTLSLLQMNLLSGKLLSALEIFLVIGIIGILTMAFLPRIKDPIFSWLSRFSFYRKIQQPVEKLINHLSDGFQILRDKGIMLRFVLFTILIWFVDAANLLVAGSIFNLKLTLPIAFVLLAAMGLSSAIPSTPGYVGVYQFVAVLVLVPLHYSQETAVAFITVMQITGFILIAIWGGIGVLFFPIKKAAIPAGQEN